MMSFASTRTPAERAHFAELHAARQVEARRVIRLEEQGVRQTVGLTITKAYKDERDDWTLELSDGSKLVSYASDDNGGAVPIPSLFREA